MLTVVGIMLAGMLTGYLLRNLPAVRVMGKLISIAIFLLLFLLGVAVGTNRTILENWSVLGVQALAVSLAAVSGSVLCAWLLYRFVFKATREP